MTGPSLDLVTDAGSIDLGACGLCGKPAKYRARLDSPGRPDWFVNASACSLAHLAEWCDAAADLCRGSQEPA